MSVDADIRLENFLTVWRERKLTDREASNRYGRRPTFWSDLRRGKKSFGEKLARTLEDQMELPRLYLDQPRTGADVTNGDAINPREGHSLTAFLTQDAPLIEWGALMLMVSGPRASVFWTTLPDDAMAPRAPAGKRICFDTEMQPRPGDGVLVQDASGAVYFRLYRVSRAGRWTAAALNPAFDELDSERDGLRVLAVLKSEEGRWG